MLTGMLFILFHFEFNSCGYETDFVTFSKEHNLPESKNNVITGKGRIFNNKEHCDVHKNVILFEHLQARYEGWWWTEGIKTEPLVGTHSG
jgi:hypothetical protein